MGVFGLLLFFFKFSREMTSCYVFGRKRIDIAELDVVVVAAVVVDVASVVVTAMSVVSGSEWTR